MKPSGEDEDDDRRDERLSSGERDFLDFLAEQVLAALMNAPPENDNHR